MAAIAGRHAWAVELLAPRAGEKVLEIGCGHGIATGLVLASGAEVVAVDRSAKMVEACRKRNAGMAGLQVVEGAFEDVAAGSFDAAFAVNVDFVRSADRGWARVLAGTVKHGGRVVLVLEAPALRTAERFALEAAANLAANGFEAETRLESAMVAVLAVRPATRVGL